MNNEVISQEIMNEIKAERLKQLKWIEKQRMGNIPVSHKDVYIGIVKSNHKSGKGVSIAFRNLCHKKITDTGKIVIAPMEKRIYLKGAGEKGYKLGINDKRTSSAYASMPCWDKCDDFVGDYDLKYDEFLGLYYIEKEDK